MGKVIEGTTRSSHNRAGQLVKSWAEERDGQTVWFHRSEEQAVFETAEPEPAWGEDFA